ncbi:MAG: endonuclease domain-containing protein [Oscillospiraceae bacterium]|nr:endonuclease domain-containing protein [Oscillospiraceae bacterium]
MDYLIKNARELRKNMTKEERRLWYDFLRDYPIRFMRQHPILTYIVDFYCSRAKIALEIDGSQHYEAEGLQKDKERDEALQSLGIEIIRIPNNYIIENFEGVCQMIDTAARKRCNL